MFLGIVDEETDIDIATSCPIQEVPKLFPDCVYVGMAFGVYGIYKEGRHPSSIKAVSVKEDAKRRGFTINALYYDPTTNKILDFVGGKDDLQKKLIRVVGNPKDRFREDKLRMIRTVRLLYQLNGKLFPEQTSLIFNPTQGMFSLEKKTERTIKYLTKELLPAVSYERI
ncbi:12521_t:CDS:2 [Ambispora leptoticha]|uniref:12521_t:CDS:1 n=1 Tax=Ambispora leptoticha TaxID=144679 RepID=A0A9N9DJT4_9GLOM|nr:12521_t:CDS:2 [Ambispora leptoticha]